MRLRVQCGVPSARVVPIFGVGVMLLVGLGSWLVPTGGPVRHVVLVVGDTVRADRLSIYGAPRPTTPFLEELAPEATVYENAKAVAPWTVPTHASLFTGLRPAEHGAQWGNVFLRPEVTTLAEHLSDHGFRTVGLSANPFVSVANGLAQGFAEYEVVKAPAHVRTSRILEQIEALLAGHDPTRRLFLFVNLMDAHLPYNFRAHGEALGARRQSVLSDPAVKWHVNAGARELTPAELRTHVEAYDAGVRAVDAALRRIADALRVHGAWDDTLFVFVSDHGEGLGQHPEMGHSISVWEEQLAVPLVIRSPGGERAGRSRALVSTEHIAPWIFDRLGVDRPVALARAPSLAAPPPLVGADYRSYFSETGRRFNQHVGAMYPWLARAVGHAHVAYCGDLKLVRWSTGSWRAYDLRADPTEQRDLWSGAQGDGASAVAQCREAYEAAGGSFTAFDHRSAGRDPGLDMDEEALRALGYLP